MFCAWCGAQNADNAINCVRCGRSVGGGATLQAQPGMQPVASVQNYLVPAILVTVLCCLPAGIVSIVYAAQVNGKLQAGDIAGAQAASKNAKTWCFVSAGVSLGIGLIYFVVILAQLASRR